MDKFERINMMGNKRLGENTLIKWYNLLINHIPKAVKKTTKSIKGKTIDF